MGVMIEHFGGALPTWLSPVQAIVLPVADRHIEYADEVAKQLTDGGMRAEADSRSERLGAKIRDAQMQKIPYMLVVGNKEVESGTASLRLRTGEDLGALPVAEIADLIARDTETKQLKPGPPQNAA
jgi:threonyl-tRNA synthetase